MEPPQSWSPSITLVLTLASLLLLYLAPGHTIFPSLRPEGIGGHRACAASGAAAAHAQAQLAIDRYLTLLEGVVTTSLFPDLGACDGWNNCAGRWPYKAEDRLGGNDWAPHGLTMVGNLRIRNVREVIQTSKATSSSSFAYASASGAIMASRFSRSAVGLPAALSGSSSSTVRRSRATLMRTWRARRAELAAGRMTAPAEGAPPPPPHPPPPPTPAAPEPLFLSQFSIMVKGCVRQTRAGILCEQ